MSNKALLLVLCCYLIKFNRSMLLLFAGATTGTEMLLQQLHSRGVFVTCEELVHWPLQMIVDQDYNELCCGQVCACV
jgi:hypothetical protein